jgi:hypothetical protein
MLILLPPPILGRYLLDIISEAPSAAAGSRSGWKGGCHLFIADLKGRGGLRIVGTGSCGEDCHGEEERRGGENVRKNLKLIIIT